MSKQVQELQYFQDLSPSKKTSSLSQYIKTSLTNISYNLKNSLLVSVPFISRKSIEINQNNYCMAYLLGKSYSFQTKQLFQQRFSKTIWISYRKVNDDTDVGWGCMIRVVQMVFAQVFQRYYHYNNDKLTEIIRLFKDEANGCLSLGNICKKGHIEKRFTSSPQIYSIMTSLLQENKKQFSQIHLTIQNYCETIQIKSQDQYEKEQFPKLLTISTKIGDQCETHFNEEYLGHLFHLIKDPNFCGMVGGANNQALYIIGEYNGLGIVLDPHYVQQQQKQETFFQKTAKGINFTQLKPSITLNFYFSNIDDFGQWVDNIILYERLSAPYVCFKTQIKNPDNWTRNHRKKSEDFQCI